MRERKEKTVLCSSKKTPKSQYNNHYSLYFNVKAYILFVKWVTWSYIPLTSHIFPTFNLEAELNFVVKNYLVQGWSAILIIINPINKGDIPSRMYIESVGLMKYVIKELTPSTHNASIKRISGMHFKE